MIFLVCVKYEGTVVTSNKMNAATDASVDIWLTDVFGKCVGPIRIIDAADKETSL